MRTFGFGDVGLGGVLPQFKKHGSFVIDVAYGEDSWKNKEVVMNRLSELSAHSAVTNNPAGVPFHEMGHLIHCTSALKTAGINPNEIYSPIKEEIYKDARNKIAQQQYLNNFTSETLEEINKRIKIDISTRATKSGEEFIAECFSQYYSGAPCKISKNVVNYFKEIWR